MENDRLLNSMLLDFYGDLLTQKQRECFDLHYNEDLSLSEIAEQLEITRQGVWDNIRRAEASLLEIEEKTGLVQRFEKAKKTISEIRAELFSPDFNKERIAEKLAELEDEL